MFVISYSDAIQFCQFWQKNIPGNLKQIHLSSPPHLVLYVRMYLVKLATIFSVYTIQYQYVLFCSVHPAS